MVSIKLQLLFMNTVLACLVAIMDDIKDRITPSGFDRAYRNIEILQKQMFEEVDLYKTSNQV